MASLNIIQTREQLTSFLLNKGLKYHDEYTKNKHTKLKSKNPHDMPIIDLNLLASPKDRQHMLDGIKIAYKIVNTDPLKDIIDFKNLDINNDDEFLKDLIENVGTFGHISCTVPMGSVVDEYGLIKHVTGLRVVDASIFPEIISGTPNSTVIMMAEHIASQIKKYN